MFVFFLYSCKKPNIVEIVNNENELFAIGQFEGPLSCTATFVEIPNSNPDAPAIIITNGHCTNDIFQDNNIQVNVPLDAVVVFKKISGIPENEYVRCTTRNILYGTMKGTDLAIIQLNISNKDLIAKGIKPLKISDIFPVIGAKIEAFGYPLSISPVILRKSEDILGASTNVSEFIWFWKQLSTSNFKDIYSGSSGSPIFSNGEKTIFGVINTTTIGAVGECELGAPCEFGIGKAPSVKDNTTYIVDITKLKYCFNNQGIFDINISSFPYEKPSDFKVNLKNNVRNFNSTSLGQNLEIEVENPLNTAYKVESLVQFDVSNKDGFINNNNIIIATPLPVYEGYYVVSVMKNNRFDQIKYLTFKTDFTAPSNDLIAIEKIKQESGGYSVKPIFKYPELTQFEWKYGTEQSCNCNDTNGYSFFNRIPVQISQNQLPYKFCIVGYDLASNKTLVKEFVIK